MTKELIGWLTRKEDSGPLYFISEWSDEDGNHPADPIDLILIASGFEGYKVKIKIDIIEPMTDSPITKW